MDTVVMSTPNVVVAPAPNPPGFYPNYASRSSFALGGIQIGAGAIALLLFVLVLAGGDGSAWGYLPAGIFYAAAGACGIAAGQLKHACQIVAFMVLSIISSVSAVPQAIGHALAAPGHEAMAVVFVLAVVFLIESIVSVWSAIICCRAVCCGRRINQRVDVGFHVQSGQVMVPPAQMAFRTDYGMSPAPYPLQGDLPGYSGNPVSYEDPPPKY